MGLPWLIIQGFQASVLPQSYCCLCITGMAPLIQGHRTRLEMPTTPTIAFSTMCSWAAKCLVTRPRNTPENDEEEDVWSTFFSRLLCWGAYSCIPVFWRGNKSHHCVIASLVLICAEWALLFSPFYLLHCLLTDYTKLIFDLMTELPLQSSGHAQDEDGMNHAERWDMSPHWFMLD